LIAIIYPTTAWGSWGSRGIWGVEEHGSRNYVDLDSIEMYSGFFLNQDTLFSVVFLDLTSTREFTQLFSLKSLILAIIKLIGVFMPIIARRNQLRL